MSQTIDDRIVQLTFDNSQFESGVQKSLKTLDQLDKSLDLKNGAKGFESVEKTIKKLDFSEVEKGSKSLEKLGKSAKSIRFDAIEEGSESLKNLEKNINSIDFSRVERLATQAGFHVRDVWLKVSETFENKVADKITNATMDLAKSLTFDQISAGLSKYEEKAANVQTIMNATGKSIEEVNTYLDKLMHYSDETSYGFTDMTSALAQMTASGGDVEKIIPLIMGVADATSFAGKSAQDFSRAIYNLNQSYTAGYLQLMDWKSFQLAGVASKQLTEELIKAGEELGKIEKGSVTLSNFTETLKDKWADTETMELAFSRFSEFSEAVINSVISGEYRTAEEAIDALSDSYSELSVKAFKAGQESKSLSEAVGAVKDEVSSQWMTSFELIFGNYEEAKEVWGTVWEILHNIFGEAGVVRNEILEVWRAAEGRENLLNAFYNLYDAVGTVASSVIDGVSSMLPSVDSVGTWLGELSAKFADFTESLIANEEVMARFQTIGAAIGTIINAVFGALGSVISYGYQFVSAFSPVLDLVLQITSGIGEWILIIGDLISQSGAIQTLGSVLTNTFDALGDVVSFGTDLISNSSVFKFLFGDMSEDADRATGAVEGTTSALMPFKKISDESTESADKILDAVQKVWQASELNGDMSDAALVDKLGLSAEQAEKVRSIVNKMAKEGRLNASDIKAVYEELFGEVSESAEKTTESTEEAVDKVVSAQEEFVRAFVKGTYGNGQARIDAFLAEGHTMEEYNAVQGKVNEAWKLMQEQGLSWDEALDKITYDTHEAVEANDDLAESEEDRAKIQKRVNELTKKGVPQAEAEKQAALELRRANEKLTESEEEQAKIRERVNELTKKGVPQAEAEKQAALEASQGTTDSVGIMQRSLQSIQGVFASVSTWWEEFKANVSEKGLFKALGDEVSKLWTNITSFDFVGWFSKLSFVKVIQTKINEIKGAFSAGFSEKGLLGGIKSAVVKFATGLWGDLKSINPLKWFSDLRKSISGLQFGTEGKTLGNIWAGFKQSLTETHPILGNVVSAIESFQTTLSGLNPFETIVSKWEAFKTSFVEGFAEGGFFTAIKDAFSSLFTSVGESADEASFNPFEGLKNSLVAQFKEGGIFAGITTAINEWITTIKAKVTALFGKGGTFEWAGNAWSAVSDTLGGAFTKVQDAFSELFSSIQDTDLWKTVSGWFTKIKDSVSSLFTDLQNINIWDTISGWFDGLGSTIQSILDGEFSTVDILGSLTNAFSGVKEAIANFFRDLFGGGNTQTRSNLAGVPSYVDVTKLDGEVTESEGILARLQHFADSVKEIPGRIKSYIDEIIQKITSFLQGDWFDNASDNVGKVSETVEKEAKNVVTVGDKIKEALYNIFSGKFFDFLTTFDLSNLQIPFDFGGIFESLKNFISEIGPDDLLAGGGIIGLLKLTGVFENFGTLAKSFSGFVDSFYKSNDTLDKATTQKLKSETVRNYAIALGLLVGSLIALTNVSWEDFGQAAAMLGILAGGLIIISLALARYTKAKAALISAERGTSDGKFDNIFNPIGRGLERIGNGVILLGIAAMITSLVGGLEKLKAAIESYSELDWGTFASGAGKIAIVLGGFAFGISLIMASMQDVSGLAVIGLIKVLFVLTSTLTSLAGVIKTFSLMSDDTFKSGGLKAAAVLAALTIAIAAIGFSLKGVNGGAMASAVGLLTLMGSILTSMAGVIGIFALMPDDVYSNGLKKVALVSGLLVGIVAIIAIVNAVASKIKGAGGDTASAFGSVATIISALYSMAMLIGIFAAISDSTYKDGFEKITEILIALGAFLAVINITGAFNKDPSGATGSLKSLAIVIGVIASVISAMSFMDQSALDSSKDILLQLLGMLTLFVGVANFTGKFNKSGDGGAGALKALAAVLVTLAGSLIALSFVDPSILQNVADVMTQLLAMVSLVAGVSGIFNKGKGALLAAMGVVIATGAVLFVLSQFGDVDKIKSTADSLSEVFLALTAAIGILGSLPSNAGISAGLNVGEFLAIFTGISAIAGGIVALDEEFGGGTLMKMLDKAQKLFGKLGELIGSFVGGIATGAVNKMGEMDDSAIQKIVDFITSIASIAIPDQDVIEEKGDSYKHIDKSLKTFAKGLLGIVESINSLKLDENGLGNGPLEKKVKYFTKIANFVKRLAAINVPVQTKFEKNGNSIKYIDKSLKKFGEGMKKVSAAINELDTGTGEKSNGKGKLEEKVKYFNQIADFVSQLAEASQKIPTQIETSGFLFNYEEIDTSLKTFGEGMVKVSESINTLDAGTGENSIGNGTLEEKAKTFTQIADFVSQLAEASQKIPEQGSIKAGLFKGMTLTNSPFIDFASGMNLVVTAMNKLEFDKSLSSSDWEEKYKYIDNIADFASKLADVSNKLSPLSASFKTKGWFGAESEKGNPFEEFANGIQTIITSLNTIDLTGYDEGEIQSKITYIESIATFTNNMATAASMLPDDVSSLHKGWFGQVTETSSPFLDLATGINSIVTAVNAIKWDLFTWASLEGKLSYISGIADFTQKMADAAAILPRDVSSFQLSWLHGVTIESSPFLDFANGVNSIVHAVNSIDWNLFTVLTLTPKLMYMNTISDFVNDLADVASQLDKSSNGSVDKIKKSWLTGETVEEDIASPITQFGTGMNKIINAINDLDWNLFAAFTVPFKIAYFDGISDFVEDLAKIKYPTEAMKTIESNNDLFGFSTTTTETESIVSPIETFANGLQGVVDAVNAIDTSDLDGGGFGGILSGLAQTVNDATGANIPTGFDNKFQRMNEIVSFVGKMAEIKIPAQLTEESAFDDIGKAGSKISTIVEDKSLETFASGLDEVATAMNEYNGKDYEFDAEGMTQIATFVGQMAEAAGKIEASNTGWKWLTEGDNSLSTFATQMAESALPMTVAAGIAGALNTTGAENLATFISTVGGAIKEGIGGEDQWEGSTMAGNAVALAGVAEAMAKGLASVNVAMSGYNPETVSLFKQAITDLTEIFGTGGLSSGVLGNNEGAASLDVWAGMLGPSGPLNEAVGSFETDSYKLSKFIGDLANAITGNLPALQDGADAIKTVSDAFTTFEGTDNLSDISSNVSTFVDSIAGSMERLAAIGPDGVKTVNDLLASLNGTVVSGALSGALTSLFGGNKPTTTADISLTSDSHIDASNVDKTVVIEGPLTATSDIMLTAESKINPVNMSKTVEPALLKIDAVTKDIPLSAESKFDPTNISTTVDSSQVQLQPVKKDIPLTSDSEIDASNVGGEVSGLQIEDVTASITLASGSTVDASDVRGGVKGLKLKDVTAKIKLSKSSKIDASGIGGKVSGLKIDDITAVIKLAQNSKIDASGIGGKVSGLSIDDITATVKLSSQSTLDASDLDASGIPTSFDVTATVNLSKKSTIATGDLNTNISGIAMVVTAALSLSSHTTIDITTVEETMATAGASLAAALCNGFISADTSGMSYKAQSAGSQAASAASSAAGSFYNAGANFSIGLGNGIGSRMSWVASKAREVAAAALAAAKAALDINSPSKETMKFGESFDEGFADGMMQEKETIQYAAKKVAKQSLTGLANALGVSGGSSKEAKKHGKIFTDSYIAGIRGNGAKVLSSIVDFIKTSFKDAGKGADDIKNNLMTSLKRMIPSTKQAEKEIDKAFSPKKIKNKMKKGFLPNNAGKTVFDIFVKYNVTTEGADEIIDAVDEDIEKAQEKYDKEKAKEDKAKAKYNKTKKKKKGKKPNKKKIRAAKKAWKKAKSARKREEKELNYQKSYKESLEKGKDKLQQDDNELQYAEEELSKIEEVRPISVAEYKKYWQGVSKSLTKGTDAWHKTQQYIKDYSKGSAKYNAELLENDEKQLEKANAIAQKSAEETKKYWQEKQKNYAKGSTEYLAISEHIADAEDQIRAEQLQKDQDKFDEQNSLLTKSVAGSFNYWDAVVKKYEKGLKKDKKGKFIETDEYKEAKKMRAQYDTGSDAWWAEKFQKDQENYDKQSELHTKSRQENLDYWNGVLKDYENYLKKDKKTGKLIKTDEYKEAEKMRDKYKVGSAAYYSEMLQQDQDNYDKQNALHTMSVAESKAYWEGLLKNYKKGTDAYDNVKKKVEEFDRLSDKGWAERWKRDQNNLSKAQALHTMTVDELHAYYEKLVGYYYKDLKKDDKGNLILTDEYLQAVEKMNEYAKYSDAWWAEKYQKDQESYDKENSLHTKSVAENYAYWNNLLKSYSQGTDEYDEVVKKRDQYKDGSDAWWAEKLKNDKNNYDTENGLHTKSVAENYAYWDSILKGYRDFLAKNNTAYATAIKQRNKYKVGSTGYNYWNSIASSYETDEIKEAEATRDKYATGSDAWWAEKFQKDQENYDKQNAIHTKSVAENYAYWDNLLKSYKQGTDEYDEVKKKRDQYATYSDAWWAEKFQKDQENYDKESELHTKSVAENYAYWNNLLKSYKQGTDEYDEVKKKRDEYAVESSNYYAELLEQQNELLSTAQERRDVSVGEELQFWKDMLNAFKKGTDEYDEVLKNIEHANNNIYKSMNDAQKTLEENIKKANEDLQKQINDIWNKREEDLKEKGKSYADSAGGLFDYFNSSTYETSDTLLANLQSQVDGLAAFGSELDKLRGRANIPEELMEALEEMGPASTENLKNLNAMTDEQLSEYISLYNKRAELGRNQAKDQIGTKEYTKQIEEARKNTAEQIEEYRKDYQDAINELGITITRSSVELNDQVAKAIGQNSGKRIIEEINKDFGKEYKNFLSVGEGIVNGVTAGLNMDALSKKIKEMCDAMMASATSALGIHSPSRVFKFYGQMIDMGLVQGLEDYEAKVTMASNGVVEESIDAMKDAISIASYIADMDTDWNPVITPVFDDSQVEEGVGYIQSLLSRQNMAIQMSPYSQIPNLPNRSSAQLQNEMLSGVVDELAKLISSNDNASITQNNTFNVTGNDPRDIANEISRILNKQVRQKERTWA